MAEEKATAEPSPTLSMVSKIFSWLYRAHWQCVDKLAIAGGICVVIIMIATVSDISRRAIFGMSIKGIVEIMIFVLLFSFILVMAKTQEVGRQVAVTFFRERFGERGEWIIRVVTSAIIFIFLGFWTWRAIAQTIYTYQAVTFRTGEINIPWFYYYLGAAIGFAFWSLEGLVEMVQAIQHLRRRQE